MSRRRRDADHALSDPRVRELLAGAEVLHSAVKAKRGPHLTPTAVSWEAERLWTVAAADSVKVRSLRRDPRIGLLISSGSGTDRHHLVAAGMARLIDPRDLPTSHGLGELLRAPFGAARYLAENSRHALGVLLDDPNPLSLVDRVVLSIALRRVALVHDDRVVEAWGGWSEAALLPTVPAPAAEAPGAVANAAPHLAAVPGAVAPGAAPAAGSLVLPDRTPAWAARLLARDGEVQLGWRSLDGPLALPATWSAADDAATTAADLLRLVGALPSGPACLTSARNSYRMREKIGIMVRGEGRAALTGDGPARMTVTPGRVTHWRGKKAGSLTTSTVRAARPAPTTSGALA